LAGQGLNLGILDARALARAIIRAATVGRDVGGEAVLEDYARARQAANLLWGGVMVRAIFKKKMN
jgi:2-polyprenylphenol 6-hydroxylase